MRSAIASCPAKSEESEEGEKSDFMTLTYGGKVDFEEVRVRTETLKDAALSALIMEGPRLPDP